MTRLTTRTRRALMATAALAVPTLPTDAHAMTAPSPSSFVELLAMVPAEALAAQGAIVSYTDMTLHWDRIGVGTDEASRLDALIELAAPETFGLVPRVFDNRSAQVDEARAEVGFGFADIERELAVTAPPRNIFIDVTTVSPDTIDAAIDSNPVWSERVTRVDTDHGGYVNWGDGTEFDPTVISPFRPLGQPGQIAIIGDPATTVRTLAAADVEAVLATAAGDDVVLQAIVQPSPSPFVPPVNASPEVIDELLQGPDPIQPYLGLAVVETTDGDATRTEVLLVHPDDESAANNAPFVETALAEGLDIVTQTPLSDVFPDASVSVEGSVVRVDITAEGAFRQAYERLVTRALFPSP